MNRLLGSFSCLELLFGIANYEFESFEPAFRNREADLITFDLLHIFTLVFYVET